MSFAEQKAKFSKDKKALDPSFKPQTNIPANIAMVRRVESDKLKNPDGEFYAVFRLTVDVETEDGILTKEWNISSESLVETLEEKGVDVGSSFTVTKTGEGFQTKYAVSNVVNKEKAVAAPSAPTGSTTTQAPAAAEQKNPVAASGLGEMPAKP